MHVLFFSEDFESGFITFRVFNDDRAAMAMCSGVKPTECNPQHVSHFSAFVTSEYCKGIRLMWVCFSVLYWRRIFPSESAVWRLHRSGSERNSIQTTHWIICAALLPLRRETSNIHCCLHQIKRWAELYMYKVVKTLFFCVFDVWCMNVDINKHLKNIYSCVKNFSTKNMQEDFQIKLYLWTIPAAVQTLLEFGLTQLLECQESSSFSLFNELFFCGILYYQGN